MIKATAQLSLIFVVSQYTEDVYVKNRKIKTCWLSAYLN